jgi:hypothetical protein
MKKSILCGWIALVVISIGCLICCISQFLPEVIAGIIGVVFTAFVLFVGMVLASVRHRQQLAEKKDNNAQILENIHQSAMKLLAQQGRAYSEVSKAMSNIVSTRVGVRVVEEMLHGLENDEQRDAAYKQVGLIIEEELVRINSEVWGEKKCPEKEA